MKRVNTITFEGFSQCFLIASHVNVTLLHFVQTIIPQYGGRQSLKEIMNCLSHDSSKHRVKCFITQEKYRKSNIRKKSAILQFLFKTWAFQI